MTMQQITLCEKWTGLCNQLFAFATGVSNAKQAGHKKASVGSFSPTLNSKQRVPVTKIIDLVTTGKRVGVELVNGTDYGRPCFGWYDRNNEQEFVHILRSIQFQPVFYTLAQKLFDKYIDSTRPLHVIHFRIEQDGITHWSRMNKMTPRAFKQQLYRKYRKAITEHIPNGSQILALTFDVNHLLLKELSKRYTIIGVDTIKLVKERIGFTGREVCAIVDLLLGIKCSGTFVGCHNLILKRGSTFSYTLWKLMNNAKKGVFLDLDKITAELQI
ncbi:hypothetical protein LCGC14_2210150, partial [marine sediment metagenome]